MPLYEFECDSCKRVFESILPLGAREAPCPACHAPAGRLILSAVTHRNADHWQKQHLSALHRSLERDEIKKEAEKSIAM